MSPAVQDLIRRRLEVVIAEVHCGDPQFDQSIGLMVRVLSNYASVGRDGTSAAIKMANPRMTEAAGALRAALADDRAWVAQTINEHPVPLKVLWRLWKETAAQRRLAAEEVWADLVRYPMVTITKAQDQALRAVTDKNLVGHARYTAAGIALPPGWGTDRPA